MKYSERLYVNIVLIELILQLEISKKIVRKLLQNNDPKKQRNFAVSGSIYLLEQIRSDVEVESVTRKLRLRVNFQQEIITLSKEVRNLKWLGFRVPLTIINKG